MGGVSYSNNEVTTDILINETIYLGEDGDDADSKEILCLDDLGRIGIDVEWNKVAPYFGVGFGRAVPNKVVYFL